MLDTIQIDTRDTSRFGWHGPYVWVRIVATILLGFISLASGFLLVTYLSQPVPGTVITHPAWRYEWSIQVDGTDKNFRVLQRMKGPAFFWTWRVYTGDNGVESEPWHRSENQARNWIANYEQSLVYAQKQRQWKPVE